MNNLILWCMAGCLLCLGVAVIVESLRIRDLEKYVDLISHAADKALEDNTNLLVMVTRLSQNTNDTLDGFMELHDSQTKINKIVWQRFEATNKWIKENYADLAMAVNQNADDIAAYRVDLKALDIAHEELAQVVLKNELNEEDI